jgi:hypothetical protein
MATNNSIKKVGLFAQLLFSLSLFSFSCTDDDTLYLSKEFQLPVEVTPKKEVFNVGDTISININFNKILTDRENTTKYLFEDYDFGTSVRIVELSDKTHPLGGQPGAIQSFQFVNNVGGIYPFGSGGGDLDLIFTGENYVFSGKMILRKSGVFNISFLNDFSGTAIAVNPPLGYKNIVAGVSPSFTLVNSGIPFNYHLFPKYTASEFDTSDSSDTRGRSFFPFVVEE